jgi:hypothetical protein
MAMRQDFLSIGVALIGLVLNGCVPGADFRVTAESLYAEFSDDIRTADVKYDRRWLEVSGEVYQVELSSGVFGGPHVEFVGRGRGSVKCVFDDKAAVWSIKQKTRAVIIGKCDGVLRENGSDIVVLRQCKIGGKVR